ncbi:MAG: glycine zipper 2TM domain-containing protein [Rhodospirillaceae bacterium]|nr:glycine zipper 2TM domain-containing protein [Rhodospirillaceae bacterium]
MWQVSFKPRAAMAAILAAMMVVSACGSTGGRASSENLTPAQRNLREEADRFNQTIGEGAIAGAIVGGILGALVSDDNRLAGAAIGAAAGAVVGGGAGYFVAVQNEDYASQEDRLEAEIAAAQQDVARYREIVRTTQQVVDQHKARIAQLNAQYRSGQVSLTTVQSEQATMRQDLELIDGLIQENRNMVANYDEEIAANRQQGVPAQSLSAARADLVREREALQAQYDELVAAVSGLPTE